MNYPAEQLEAAATFSGKIATRYQNKLFFGLAAMLTPEQAQQVYRFRLLMAAWYLLNKPEKFALPDLRRAYESLDGQVRDIRNFRRELLSTGLVVDTGEKTDGQRGRPAVLYSVNPDHTEGLI